MDKKKLWIFTELFFPEETSTSYILTKISNKLAKKYKIKVVCGEPVYDLNEKTETSIELDSSIDVDRIKGFRVNKNNLFSRVFRFVYLSFGMSKRLLLNVKRNEKVFIVTNPAPLILFSAFIKKIINYELIILVHDVFPENTIPSGVLKSKNSIIFKSLKGLFDRAYSKADLLIVLGRDMKSILHSKIRRYNSNPRIEIIENWGDVEDIKPIGNKTKSKYNNKIVFLYAGNLGRLQGFMEFLEILKDVQNSLIHFRFVGDGAVKEKMIEFVSEQSINQVSFEPSFRRNEQGDILNECDMAVVLLAEGMEGLGVPSKAYNIMAAGKPIFFVGDAQSEISLLIKEMNIGVSFEFSDKQRIINYLEDLTLKDVAKYARMGKVSRKLAEEKFSEDIILEKFLNTV